MIHLWYKKMLQQAPKVANYSRIRDKSKYELFRNIPDHTSFSNKRYIHSGKITAISKTLVHQSVNNSDHLRYVMFVDISPM